MIAAFEELEVGPNADEIGFTAPTSLVDFSRT
jgi:hypothetical protein